MKRITIRLNSELRLADVVGEGTRRGCVVYGIQDNADGTREVSFGCPEEVILDDLNDVMDR